jgi:hypothetical protein
MTIILAQKETTTTTLSNLSILVTTTTTLSNLSILVLVAS